MADKNEPPPALSVLMKFQRNGGMYYDNAIEKKIV